MTFSRGLDWYPIAWRFRRITLLTTLALLPLGILLINLLAGVKGENPLTIVAVLAAIGGVVSLKLWFVVTILTGGYWMLRPEPIQISDN